MAKMHPGWVALGSVLGVATIAVVAFVLIAPGMGLDAGQRHYAALASAAPTAPDPEAAAQQARARISRLFTDYDALPAAQKVKPALLALQKTAVDLIVALPAPHQGEISTFLNRAYRPRMAPLIRPQSHATGPASETLVPSPNAAECGLWGSMWVNDDETLQSMLSLGFEHISCGPKKEWHLLVEAARCYLYWDAEPDHEVGDAIFIWKDAARYQRQLIAGKRRGDDAILGYMGLVSEGAITVTGGGTFAIVSRGDGWLQIRGTGERQGQDGIVDARACHRKKQKG